MKGQKTFPRVDMSIRNNLVKFAIFIYRYFKEPRKHRHFDEK